MPFHVDGEKIKSEGGARLAENVIERAHGDLDDLLRLRARRHSVTIERRQRAGQMQLHAPSRVLWRRASHRKHFGRARVAQIARELGLRFDQDAGPTELLKVPGLRFLLRPIGADLDKEARPRAAEKLPNEYLLAALAHAHRSVQA